MQWLYSFQTFGFLLSPPFLVGERLGGGVKRSTFFPRGPGGSPPSSIFRAFPPYFLCVQASEGAAKTHILFLRTSLPIIWLTNGAPWFIVQTLLATRQLQKQTRHQDNACFLGPCLCFASFTITMGLDPRLLHSSIFQRGVKGKNGDYSWGLFGHNTCTWHLFTRK